MKLFLIVASVFMIATVFLEMKQNKRLDALERNQEENKFTGATGYAIDTTNGVEYHYWLKGESGTNSLIPYN